MRCASVPSSYQCNDSLPQQAHLASLPPPPKPEALRPPPHSKVLLYGTSYLGQVGQAFVCPTYKWHSCVPAEVSLHNERGEPITCAWHWFWEESNATLVMVVNNATLQRTTTVYRYLPLFLRRERFTHVVFQQPHKNCFFDYLEGGKVPENRCVVLSNVNGPPASMAQRNVLEHHCHTHGVPFLSVLGWSDRQLYADALKLDDERSGAIRRGASTNATLYPYEVLESPCTAPTCTDDIPGHHCLPGALTLVALRLTRVLRAMQVPALTND